MPVVPRPQIQVDQAPLSNARVRVEAPIEAFGGGKVLEKTEAAFQGATNDFIKIAAHEKSLADESRTKVAGADALRLSNEKKYGKDGFMRLKGVNALGSSQKYVDDYKSELSKIADTMSNDDQRRIFQNISIGLISDYENDITRHSADQAKAYQNEANNSFLSASRDDAVLNWGDPAKLDRSIKYQELIIEDQANEAGLSGQGKEIFKKETLSKTYLGVMSEQLDNKQYPLAQKLYDEKKDQMSQGARDDAEKLLHASKIEHEGFSGARDILKKYGASSKALQEAMNIEDDDVRKEVVRNIKDTIDIRKMQQDEFEKANFKRAADLVENTKERPPASVWNALSLSERKALDDRREQLIKGVDPETDMGTYQELSSLAAENPSAFANQNLGLTQSKLSKSDFKKFVDLQSKIKAEGSTGGFGTQQDIVTKTLMENGIDTKPRSGEGKKQLGLFYRRFRERVDGLGAKPSDKDVQTIADSLLTETITDDGWIWDSKKKTFQVSIDDVPKSDLSEIRAALKAKNIPDTDANILQVYTRGNSAK